MRFSVVFLALFALAAAIPATPKHAADQDFLKKQQDVIYLLENIGGTLPYQQYYEMGMNYTFDTHYDSYENPSVVKYYYGLYLAGQIQPMGTPYSYSVSQLRKEVALLTQIFLGAKDYQTFLYTAAWARVHVNQDQFVAAFSSAVIQLPYMYGVVLPAPYEVFPHYFFSSHIIQQVQNYVNKYGFSYHGENHGAYDIYVNYTTYLPHGENQIAYFTEDIGLATYYYYVQLASHMMPYGQYAQKYEQGAHDQYTIGHGSYYYYIHQQLLARYNLERLSQGLGPIPELDYYYEHITVPYSPQYSYLNGMHFPGRDEHVYVTPSHHNYELVKLVRLLENRILDAIHAGHVITPQGAFLSLYQPQGLNILGNLIEGTGRSVNPRYYGAFQYVAMQLLGNAPEFHNIHEYTPSVLELGQTAVHDPMFYMLFNKIIELFHYYQEALPAYQYSDVVVPGVSIEKVEFSELMTYFSEHLVSLDNAVVQPVGQHQEHQPYPHVVAHLQHLDHKPYEYSIHVQAKQVVPGAVVRVYIGPKYNYNGEPININEYRHYFYEIDQFMYDLVEGSNVIVRNSHQATGMSHDWPSVHQLFQGVQGAFSSQSPYYINYPEQLYGFPARLTFPKGSHSGFPLQVFVIISSGAHSHPMHYGPVVEEEWMTYQPQHYQIVGHEQYEQFSTYPADHVHGGYQTIEVIPDFQGQPIVEGPFHYGYLYSKYPVSYYYPSWQHHHGHYPHGQYPVHQQSGSVNTHSVNMGHVPYAYQQVYSHPEGGVYQQAVYKQGSYQGYGQMMYHGQQGVHQSQMYHGSGHYSGSQGSYGYDQYLHNYYQNQYIGDIIGGAVSLDNKPLGYPFDRPLAYSVFYAHNIYVTDVLVYHQDYYHY